MSSMTSHRPFTCCQTVMYCAVSTEALAPFGAPRPGGYVEATQPRSTAIGPFAPTDSVLTVASRFPGGRLAYAWTRPARILSRPTRGGALRGKTTAFSAKVAAMESAWPVVLHRVQLAFAASIACRAAAD